MPPWILKSLCLLSDLCVVLGVILWVWFSDWRWLATGLLVSCIFTILATEGRKNDFLR